MENLKQKQDALYEQAFRYCHRALEANREGNTKAAQRLYRLQAQCHLKVAMLGYIHTYGDEQALSFLGKMIADIEFGLYK
ncbi:MAG: hypothetical protein ACK41O_05610 [Runella zeae]